MQADYDVTGFSLKDFENGKKCVSLGRIPPDIVDFLISKVPSLSPILSSNAEILFWKDRIAHTERHKKDFMSDNEFYNCIESIPSIIQEPDYISVHKKSSSISFIKEFSSHVSVAVHISADGKLAYRTMYPLMDAQLTNYIDKGHAWTWNKSDTSSNNLREEKH
ncbi:MAG: hypothetical protein LIP10_13290 [Clostridiales bacterium]|nr:hypothetical protein [Clostridiales bacterium]